MDERPERRLQRADGPAAYQIGSTVADRDLIVGYDMSPAGNAKGILTEARRIERKP